MVKSAGFHECELLGDDQGLVFRLSKDQKSKIWRALPYGNRYKNHKMKKWDEKCSFSCESGTIKMLKSCVWPVKCQSVTILNQLNHCSIWSRQTNEKLNLGFPQDRQINEMKHVQFILTFTINIAMCVFVSEAMDITKITKSEIPGLQDFESKLFGFHQGLGSELCCAQRIHFGC